MVLSRGARRFGVAFDDRFHQAVDFPDALRLTFPAHERLPPEARGPQHETVDDVKGNRVVGARTDAIVEGAFAFDDP